MTNYNISLIDQSVDTSKFTEFKTVLPTLFLGFAIKNEYDNQRLKINEDYEPTKQLFLFEREEGEFSLLPLYGIFLNLNELGRKLASAILTSDLNNKDNRLPIKTYEKILYEYKVSCFDSYSYLNKRIYPLDFKHLETLSDDYPAKDKKILQHLLNLEEDKFDFHKFGALKLLILA